MMLKSLFIVVRFSFFSSSSSLLLQKRLEENAIYRLLQVYGRGRKRKEKKKRIRGRVFVKRFRSVSMYARSMHASVFTFSGLVVGNLRFRRGTARKRTESGFRTKVNFPGRRAGAGLFGFGVVVRQARDPWTSLCKHVRTRGGERLALRATTIRGRVQFKWSGLVYAVFYADSRVRALRTRAESHALAKNGRQWPSAGERNASGSRARSRPQADYAGESDFENSRRVTLQYDANEKYGACVFCTSKFTVSNPVFVLVKLMFFARHGLSVCYEKAGGKNHYSGEFQFRRKKKNTNTARFVHFGVLQQSMRFMRFIVCRVVSLNRVCEHPATG